MQPNIWKDRCCMQNGRCDVGWKDCSDRSLKNSFWDVHVTDTESTFWRGHLRHRAKIRELLCLDQMTLNFNSYWCNMLMLIELPWEFYLHINDGENKVNMAPAWADRICHWRIYLDHEGDPISFVVLSATRNDDRQKSMKDNVCVPNKECGVGRNEWMLFRNWCNHYILWTRLKTFYISVHIMMNALTVQISSLDDNKKFTCIK